MFLSCIPWPRTYSRGLETLQIVNPPRVRLYGLVEPRLSRTWPIHQSLALKLASDRIGRAAGGEAYPTGLTDDYPAVFP